MKRTASANRSQGNHTDTAYASASGGGRDVPLPEKWRRRLREQPSVSFERHLLPLLLCLCVAFVAISYLLGDSNRAKAERSDKNVEELTQKLRMRQQEKTVPQKKEHKKEVPIVDNVKDDEKKVELSTGGKRFLMELGGLTGDKPTAQIVIETKPEWAPLGAARFHELVQSKFYDQCRFFRVLPNFVVQFGIAADPMVQKQWRGKSIQDDPVVESNQRGTLTYAMSGKNTRTTQLFINKKNNKYLDKEGFSPFGKVVSGMEYVDLINGDYKEKPNQGKIQNRGNEYLNADFPNLSYIVTLREANEGEGGMQQ